MADAFHVQPLGDEGAKAVQLAVDDIVPIGRGRADGHVHMSAHQGVDGLLSAVIGNRLGGDAQGGEQGGNHGEAVVSGAAGGGVLHRVSGVGVVDQALDIRDAAGSLGQDDELRDADAHQRGDILNGVVHADEAGGQGEQGAVAAEEGVAVVCRLQEVVHADGAGASGVVFHDHGHAQELVAVRGDLPGDNVRAAAQAPGLDDLDLLLGPLGVAGGGAAAGLAALGGLAAAVGVFSPAGTSAGRKAQDHQKSQGERHQFLHRSFSFSFVLINFGVMTPESISRVIAWNPSGCEK